MFKRWFAVGLTCLCLASPLVADEQQQVVERSAWSVYVNGEQKTVTAFRHNGIYWFEAQTLARALGAALLPGPDGKGLFVNGQPLQQPVIYVQNTAFTTAEAMGKSLSARVQVDPVRLSAFYEVSKANPDGIPYYSADYVTPDEQYRRQRREELGENADAILAMEEHDEKMAAEFAKVAPYYGYNRRAPDFRHPINSEADMFRPISEEELENNTLTQASRKPEHVPSGYISRSANNGLFSVMVTDCKLAEALKGLNPPLWPQPGNKFLVVHLRVENVSKSPQRAVMFNVRDQNGTAFSANQTYSQFSLAKMRSREATSGFLIFEIPVSAQPVALEAQVSPPLSLSLMYR